MKNYNKKIKGGNTPISMNDPAMLNSNMMNKMSTEIMNRQFDILYSTTPTLVHSDSPPTTTTTTGGARQKRRSHKKKISSKNKRNGKKRRTTRIY
jgi:hypothetical protein